MSGNCRSCKGWKGCQHDCNWFSYADIGFCALQVFWLLKYAETLRIGLWPTPDATADPRIRGQMSAEATFTKSIRIIAEVDYRLKRTGWRGRLLAEQCINREKMMYLDDDTRDALYYVSGWARKALPFESWRKQRRYRQMTTQKSSQYAEKVAI